ncbi:enoyl-CoA hydratase [Prescottella subtropica]|uniref:enoyl-CoA hydratase n=1 Tax=Prescottella subtropica TaxID=2545757 RepID=UPI0010F5EE1F|nr:enoyl-CoA hydratase [Prescottella subtropica]
MLRRGRKTMIALDSGDWCLARVVGKRSNESGVRVRFVAHRAGERYPTYTIVECNAGDGFAL